MLDWERRALGLGPSDAPRVLRRVSANYGPSSTIPSTGTAWWVVALFGPEIWRRWGVGLQHGSVNLGIHEDVELPGIEAEGPQEICTAMGSAGERWRRATISPVLVEGEALGFVIRASVSNPRYLEVFAPTRLVTRLALVRGAAVELEVLASGFM